MYKKVKLFLVLFLLLPNLTISALAANNPVDEFYTSLPGNEYKEYSHANVNVREKVLGKDLAKASAGLGEYTFPSSDFSGFSSDKEYYFFASAIENKQMIIKKYAIYDIDGKRVAAGIHSHAKKEAVMKKEFNGWDTPFGQDELSNKRE